MYRIQRVLLLPLGGKLFWYERLSQLTQCAPSSPFLYDNRDDNRMTCSFLRDLESWVLGLTVVHPSAPLATSVMPVVKSVLKRVSGRV